MNIDTSYNNSIFESFTPNKYKKYHNATEKLDKPRQFALDEPLGMLVIDHNVYFAGYSEDSTDDDPTIIIADYKVHVNEVNPYNCTGVELFTWISHKKKTGEIPKKSGIDLFHQITAQADWANDLGFVLNVHDANTLGTQKFNWVELMEKMRDLHMQSSATYQQGLECDRIINNLVKAYKPKSTSICKK